MAYVIAEPCIGQKDNSCVEVCPVDCIHPTPDEADYDAVEQLYIDPDECIDCAVCIPECPVNAIYPEEDVPPDQRDFTALNAELAKIWPMITETKSGLPEAEEFKDVKEKRQYLER